jgi:hypothetical protein
MVSSPATSIVKTNRSPTRSSGRPRMRCSATKSPRRSTPSPGIRRRWNVPSPLSRIGALSAIGRDAAPTAIDLVRPNSAEASSSAWLLSGASWSLSGSSWLLPALSAVLPVLLSMLRPSGDGDGTLRAAWLLPKCSRCAGRS